MDQTSLHASKTTYRPMNVYEKVKRLFDFEAAGPKKILNVGSGSGILDQFLRDKGYEVVSLDVLPPLNGAYLKESDFIKTDINLPWPVERSGFDLVICTDVPEHLYDPMHVLREAKLALKENGKLIFGVPNHFDLRQRLRTLFGNGIVHWDSLQYGETAWLYAHIRFFNLADLKKMFSAAAWQIEKFQFNFMGGGLVPRSLTPNFFRRWLVKKWPALFSGKFIVLAAPRSAQPDLKNTKTEPKFIYLDHTPEGL